jgi:hypothetical protein
MKEIFEMEEKPFTSSLNICPEACRRKGCGLAYLASIIHLKTT